MMLKIILPLALAALLGTSAGAQDTQTPSERFQLFNECRPMFLSVTPYEGDADYAAIGLTTDRIQTMAESRLRAARLYDADAETILSVFVRVSSRAFTSEVSYYKPLYDVVSDVTAYAKTWIKSSVGTHGGDAGYILQGLSEKLDEFILEYLRVNEAACFPVPRPPQRTR